ncbi:MAG: hypothetical protein ABJC66_11445 [Gammaproteobacteria bacterium]
MDIQPCPPAADEVIEKIDSTNNGVEHMKMVIAALCLMAAGVVQAQTVVNLGTLPCTATHICFNVPNDGAIAVDYISDAIQYKRLVISVGGDIYDSGVWTLDGALNQTGVSLYDPLGNSILVTIVLTDYVSRTCRQNGKTCTFTHSVTLVSGNITLP